VIVVKYYQSVKHNHFIMTSEVASSSRIFPHFSVRK